ncbi:MAG: ABC transporter ATP-binding protein [Planctomycetota bacterium]
MAVPLEEDVGPEFRLSSLKPALFKRVFSLFRGHSTPLWVGIFCVLIHTGVLVSLPLVFRQLIDQGIAPRNLEVLLLIAGAYLAMLIVRVILEYLQTMLLSFMGITIVNDLKKQLLQRVLQLSIRFFDQNKPGKLISRIESDAQQLYMLFSDVGIKMVSATLNIICAFAIMFVTSVTLTLYTIAFTPIFLSGAYLIFHKMRPMFKKERKNYSELNGFLGEHLPAIPLLRNLNNLDWSRQQFERVNQGKYRFSLRIEFLETIVWFFMMLTPLMMITMILHRSVYWVDQKIMTLGTVWMFIQYVQAAIWPLIMISEQLREIQRAFGASERIFELWDTEIEVKDPVQPKTVSLFKEAIRFENVSFAYDPKKPVLKNVSFNIEKGSTVALVGATGAGKTTSISLLARWYDPTSGRITLDGIDIRHFRQKDWLSQMSFVLQDIFLFPGTVTENLRALRTDISDETVKLAAQKMGADSIIQKFPQHYETVLKEQGKNLSFGERQLLSFSRALTFNPEILVIDEATSSVDPQTEQQIQQSLETLLEGRTSVIIAHRLSTIIHSDKIIVFHQGEVIEEGSHLELLKKNGSYARLYQLQRGGEHYAELF